MPKTLPYIIRDPVELNLSYMPFIRNGGLFIPSFDTYHLGEEIIIELQLPGKKDSLKVVGIIVWITPNNALHHVLAGIGVEFVGENAPSIKAQIEMQLDNSLAVGGYTYGMTEEQKKK